MSNALIPVITTAGIAAVFNAQSTGLKAEVTHIVLGDNGRTPSKDETGLVNERMRIPVAGGERINDHQIHLTALADGDAEFWIREVGFILADGTMLAVWSDTTPLAYKSKTVPLLLAFDLVLAALPADSVEVIGTDTSLSLAGWGEQLTVVASGNISNMARHVELLYRVLPMERKVEEIEPVKLRLDDIEKSVSSLSGSLEQLVKNVVTRKDMLAIEGEFGEQRLPGGLKMIWGYVIAESLIDGAVTAQQIDHTFDSPFESECFVCVPVGCDDVGLEGSEMSIGVISTSKSGVSFRAGRVSGSATANETIKVNFVAIGK